MKLPIRIVVLCGGISNEREVSLKSGAQVYGALSSNPRFKATLVDILPDLSWRDITPGVAESGLSLALADKKDPPFDVAFIALHGKYGEDGGVQSYLNDLAIPFTGSDTAASALAMDKAAASEAAIRAGLTVPDYTVIRKDDFRDAQDLFKNVAEKIGSSLVIKPSRSGSSVGVSLVRARNEFEAALELAFAHDREVIAQRRIEGAEFTCGVLGNSGGAVEALPPVEIQTGAKFFDYDAKYKDATREICPPVIDAKSITHLQDMAVRVHVALGCDGLTRSDFMRSADGTFYYLETNTIPGLTSTSLCPKEAAAAGMDFAQFAERIVDLAIQKYGKK